MYFGDEIKNTLNVPFYNNSELENIIIYFQHKTK